MIVAVTNLTRLALLQIKPVLVNNVSIQIASLQRLIRTVGAFKWLFSSVCSHVVKEVTLGIDSTRHKSA